MVRLCSTITDFTGLFLFLALLVALADIGLTFWSRWKARDITPKRAAADPDKLAKLVEALTKLLLALKDLPSAESLLYDERKNLLISHGVSRLGAVTMVTARGKVIRVFTTALPAPRATSELR